MKREYIKGRFERYNGYCDDAVGSGVLIGGRTRGEGAGTPPLKYGVLSDVLVRNFTGVKLIVSKAL